jgi:hypothetical protein
MTTPTYEIFLDWDQDAQVWYVAESNVPGLVAEAPTQESMTELLKRRVPELLELNTGADPCSEQLPLELLVQSRQRLRIRC